MDPQTFIVTALAGALLKEIATDGYKAVKYRLVDAFGLGGAVAALENDPRDQDARDFAVKMLAKSGATEDPEVLDGAQLIADELGRLPEDTPIIANFTVRDLKAETVEFRNNRVRSGGALLVDRVEATGKIVFEGNEVGDDRKR